MNTPLTLADYQSLSELRHQIRKFLRFSEQSAGRAGLESRQHQLLLAVKGMPAGQRPRIADLSKRLQIKHHSTVELVNRLVARGYACRHRGEEDRRVVLVSLTAAGEKILHKLSLHHRAELRMHGPALIAALKRVVQSANSGKPKVRRQGD